jgi:hypothetical protein
MFTLTDLEAMVTGYATTALWSSTDGTCTADPHSTCGHAGRPIGEHCDPCRYGGPPMDDAHTVEDIHPDTMATFRTDCESFARENAADLEGMDPSQAGHDLWLTRNGHGAGFWDRGLGERGERLSEAARVYGSADLYVGDDGAIHT